MLSRYFNPTFQPDLNTHSNFKVFVRLSNEFYSQFEKRTLLTWFWTHCYSNCLLSRSFLWFHTFHYRKNCWTLLKPQILCHMISDVKWSHYFLLIKVKQRYVLNFQIIQKTISKHHPLCECRKTSTVGYISLQTVFLLI